MVAIDLPGYKHYEMPVKRRVNGWLFGNFVFGDYFPAGMLIDGIDGSIYALDPNTIDANLQPGGTRRRAAGSTVSDDAGIGLSGRPARAGWRKIGQLERL